MGRTVMVGPGPSNGVRIPTVVRATVLLWVALAAGCALGSSAPSKGSLAELTTQGESLVGERVVVTGTVRVFEPHGSFPRHYVLEDRQQHRVALVPGDLAAGYVDREVIAVGRFEFDDTAGRLLRLDMIDASTQRR